MSRGAIKEGYARVEVIITQMVIILVNKEKCYPRYLSNKITL